MMENSNAGAIVVFIVAALPCLIGAYLIGVKRCMFLIAGWDPDKYHTHNAIAQIFGWGLFVGGLMMSAAALLDYLGLFGEEQSAILILAGAATVIATGFYCNVKFRIKPQ
ncbi:hypothetical protein [Pseudoalteromonas rubra]|uniref:hypothetical protein n=1 Tax=Pseudoalteromonas rubra TaxID=43658 RepID=UPI000F76C60D|nr:hypothetical protein [Pseudoalteromonas rubra]